MTNQISLPKIISHFIRSWRPGQNSDRPVPLLGPRIVVIKTTNIIVTNFFRDHHFKDYSAQKFHCLILTGWNSDNNSRSELNIWNFSLILIIFNFSHVMCRVCPDDLN